MRRQIAAILSADDGLEVVEYAIVGGLITFGIVLTLTAIGGWVQNVFTSLAATVGA